ncbi:hypothetical protein IQ22_03920 [Pseudomonas duriflava]|uniref:Uncharacterized protein n=1 Tax=Pseudomonas duriflava TaxID=459528 RepID=A0A562PYV4_9PSED|nr:hypothetical protein IQ22_03920 [Pseudomonas duriflava]
MQVHFLVNGNGDWHVDTATTVISFLSYGIPDRRKPGLLIRPQLDYFEGIQHTCALIQGEVSSLRKTQPFDNVVSNIYMG